MKSILFLIALAAQAAAGPKLEIGNLRDQWGRALHDKQIDQALNLYTDDAIFFLPQGGHVDGAAAIRNLFTTITQTFDSDIHFQSKAVAVSGNLATDAGDFEETLVTRATGAKIESRGSYLMVLRRGMDGKWKIAQQMWTGTPPESH
jgi:uncharacterized protein (TIGR02246 family)